MTGGDFSRLAFQPVYLTLGQINPDITAVFKSMHTECCTFISAGDPSGKQFDEAQNDQRMDKLAKELRYRV